MNAPKIDPTELRRMAEEKFQTLETSQITALSQEEVEDLFHELRVHQIELEMQNEDLRLMQEALQHSRARYFDLYDLAPVGYITLSEKGIILEANLTVAALLGHPRNTLDKMPISKLILDKDQDIYYLCRKKLFETGTPQLCELRMRKPDQSTLWLKLEAVLAHDEEGAPIGRVTLSDISQRKQLEEKQHAHIREMEQFNKMAVGRELRMIELKKEINALSRKLGKEDPYPVH